MQISLDKAFYRQKYRKIRDCVKNSEKDEMIFCSVIDSPSYKNADVIFTYYSVRSEIDTVKIINKALSDGKKVALPKCTDNKGHMDFYFIEDSADSLVDGFYSIKEPDAFKCELAVPGKKNICIVPALSFDTKGYRLGYGGGYYDRFLQNFNGEMIGLCYEECLCDALPYNEYDIKVDIIVTDKKIYELK